MRHAGKKRHQRRLERAWQHDGAIVVLRAQFASELPTARQPQIAVTNIERDRPADLGHAGEERARP